MLALVLVLVTLMLVEVLQAWWYRVRWTKATAAPARLLVVGQTKPGLCRPLVWLC